MCGAAVNLSRDWFYPKARNSKGQAASSPLALISSSAFLLQQKHPDYWEKRLYVALLIQTGNHGCVHLDWEISCLDFKIVSRGF